MIGSKIELYIKYYESTKKVWQTQEVLECFIGKIKFCLDLQGCIDIGQAMNEWMVWQNDWKDNHQCLL